MPTALQIGSIATTLDAYHSQLSSLSQALGALREASEQVLAQLEKDRAALATLARSEPATASDTIEMTDTGAASAMSGLEQPLAASSEDIITGEIELQLAAEAGGTAATDTDTDTDTFAEITVVESVSSELDSAETTEAGTTTFDAATATAPEIEEQVSDATEAVIASGDADRMSPVAAADHELNALATDAHGAIASTPAAEAQSDAVAATGLHADGATGETPSTDDNVVSLEAKRQQRDVGHPVRRRAMAIVASLVVTAGAVMGTHELMQSELGQRIVDLAVCDGDMLSANRNCTLLAWFLL